MATANLETSQGKQAPANGIDPNIKVPDAVRKAAARSEELMKQSKGIVEAAPAAPEAPPAKAAEPAAPPAAPEAPKAPPAPSNTDDDWQGRYNAMKGRFDQSTKTVQQLTNELNNLRNVVATMQAAPPAPPPIAPEQRASSLLSQQEIEEYGPEFLEVVGKKAREIAAAETAEIRQRLEQLQNGVRATAEVSAQSARDTMLTQLDEKLPDWRKLNTDQNFLDWLRLPDTFSGAIRHELLKAAYEQNNSLRVMAFFNGFLAEQAAVAPANEAPPVPGNQPKVSLEQFAAPGRAKSTAANAPVEKPIITRAQVAAFYADVAAGKYRGRDAEKAQAEAEIFAANNEGRLR